MSQKEPIWSILFFFLILQINSTIIIDINIFEI
jgi:hypothetical protein